MVGEEHIINVNSILIEYFTKHEISPHEAAYFISYVLASLLQRNNELFKQYKAIVEGGNKK